MRDAPTADGGRGAPLSRAAAGTRGGSEIRAQTRTADTDPCPGSRGGASWLLDGGHGRGGACVPGRCRPVGVWLLNRKREQLGGDHPHRQRVALAGDYVLEAVSVGFVS